MPDPFSLPFPQAIAIFRDKVAMPTETYQDLLAVHHAYAFSVAGLTSAQMLGDVQNLVTQQMQNGIDYRQFQRDFARTIEESGWGGNNPYRANLVLQQNFRQAYGRGRYEQLTTPAMLERRPYWQWLHRGAVRPRPDHVARNGMVRPANDAFFVQHWPPDGFMCHCTINSQADPPNGGISDITREMTPPDGQREAGSLGNPQNYIGRRDTLLSEALGRLPAHLARQVSFLRTPLAALSYEDEIRDLPVEYARVYDPHTGQIMLEQTSGSDSAVEFSARQLRQMRGGILTHNHPLPPGFDPNEFGVSFSPDDWDVATFAQLQEMRAVSGNYRYSLSAPPGGWSQQWWDEIGQPVYNRHYDGVMEILDREVIPNIGVNISRPRRLAIINNYFFDEVNRRVANELGLEYRREVYRPHAP